MEMFSIKLRYSVAYRAQNNGLVERSNASIVGCLRTITRDHPKNWDSILPCVVTALNNTMYDPIGLTPAIILHGMPMRFNFQDDVHDEPLQPRHEIYEEILLNQKYAHDIAAGLHRRRAELAKARFDKEHKPACVVPGTVVYFKRARPERLGESTKLHRRFDGPYVVVTLKEGNAILKHLLDGTYHHGTVNVSQLKVPNYYESNDGRIVLNKKGKTEEFAYELPQPFYQNHKHEEAGKQGDGEDSDQEQ
jgi:hypothetical protein